jgi:hypothetical protein
MIVPLPMAQPLLASSICRSFICGEATTGIFGGVAVLSTVTGAAVVVAWIGALEVMAGRLHARIARTSTKLGKINFRVILLALSFRHFHFGIRVI